jgi:hypothetical protein
MTERLIHVVGFCAATAIVVGSGYVILSKGAGIIATPSVSAPSSGQPERTYVAPLAPAIPPDARLDTQPSQSGSSRTGSGIYRCVEKGGVVYANEPCANGREIEVRPSSGFAPPVLRAGVEQRPQRQESSGSYGSSSPIAASETPAPEPLRAARCAAIDAQIEQVDAMARAGGTASYQDQLRARRHALVDEKYRLRC